jgi:hypothetical protein
MGAAVRRDAAERVVSAIAPSEGRTLLGSQDYAEVQKRSASEDGSGGSGEGGGGEGTSHKAAVLRWWVPLKLK